MLTPPHNPAQLAQRLLAHYDRHGRDLPWRGERSLYRIWLSEIMLQQTTVAAVIPYYTAFLQHFPDVESLAAAQQEDVLRLWQGLGYYARARNLHRAAQQVAGQYGGCFPESPEMLEALPGVGRSTAAAILAIGRDHHLAILDGNVKRVLTRLTACAEPPDKPGAKRALWTLAQQLTCPQRPGDYAQAIMDLGATLCSRSKPQCPLCPWAAWCRAHQAGEPTRYPVKAPKRAAKPQRHQACLLIVDASGERILLRQRPNAGLLAGMWEPPGSAMADNGEGVDVAALCALYGVCSSTLHTLETVQHTFTHFHLALTPYQTRLTDAHPTEDLPEQPHRWTAWADLDATPMATLHRKALAMLRR
ncbi:A/G-specific adenine glycosylase [Magnetofaba australis]|uniref:Adenine DNA glycosylase n=1 Tax=Magnetofaba australis IT-1 TaxID=1434232 RepID=A0A1Y2K7E3_9PROT|nr:A/G-specific adenine glycosylase [Magnetofaba australis]OSM06247.1 putative A/G-specific DNA-adenine glycosylase [Magnetofaba australis IT-1]